MATFVTQIEGDTMMMMEAETSGTFAKSDLEIKPNPMAAFDNAIDNASLMARVLSGKMSQALAGTSVESAEVSFGIKIDQAGSILIAQESDKAQFQVRIVFKVS